MGKKVLFALGLAGLVALSVKEFPALMREIKIYRMSN